MPILKMTTNSYIRFKYVKMDLNDLFTQAVEESKDLKDRPSNDTMLQLYSFYKQATLGDANGEAPNMFDFVAKAKYEAWSSLKGKTKEAAMQDYINLVGKLKV
jgi:diazepam-binding inhibitor (GABA receptor modulating acyl-CoA-binding protein)